MSLSRKELKNSLKQEKAGLEHKRKYFNVIHQNDDQAILNFKRIEKLETDIKELPEKKSLSQQTKANIIAKMEKEIMAAKNAFKFMNKQSQQLVNKMPDNFPEKNDLITLSLSERYKYLKSAIKNLDAQISEKDSSVIALNTKRGDILRSIRSIRSMGLSNKSRKGGRKSKRRSRKNKRKTRRKGGVLTSSASTAVADMTYKREKSKKDDNSKTVKDSKVKDSKKKGESGFSFKLTKKMAPNFKKKKIYGGEDENLFISDKLNIDPNKKYKTIGIAHHTELAGINLVRDMGNDLFNMFGQKGFDTGLYNRARNDGIRVLINKLKSNQVLKSPKFDIELKDQQGIQVHITALVMEEVSDKEEKEKKD